MNINKVNRNLAKKGKRGKRKSVKSVHKNLIFGGVNPDGALSKLTTIRKAIRETGSAVWTMQETKVSKPGKLKFDGFITYEHTRCNQEGGGISLSALKDLNPAFVRDGGEDVEALTVNINLKQITISCNTGYGPQESAPYKKKESFWKYFEEECQRSKKEGHGFILQGDLNSWLGPDILPGDTKKQNQNGKLLVNFVESNKLTIVNTLPICKGTKTWTRIRQGVTLSSTLDFFVVCERVLPYIMEMNIDNDRKYRITNFRNKNKVTQADHVPMTMKVSLMVQPEKPQKIEILNFRNINSQLKCRENTTKTSDFSDCFKSKMPFSKQIQNWKHMLDKHCKKAFPIIRIRKKNIQRSKSNALIDKRNTLLRNNVEDNSSQELKDLNANIAIIIAEEERMKCHTLKKFWDQSGSINLSEMWKLKKKMWPNKQASLPTAKINHKGRLASSAKDIKSALRKEYMERLRSRPKHPKMEKLLGLKLFYYS